MLASSACAGPQSALAPAGVEAARVSTLLSWLTAGSVVVLAIVVAIMTYAARPGRAPRDERAMRRFVWVAGAAVPTVVLTAVLVYGLALLPDLLGPAPRDAVRVHVTGAQWWWRVRYERAGGAPVELANELVLPAGRAVELELESADVIHSLWIPALGGKVDMIPGRTNRLLLHPTRVGEYRGVCAEYCGASHAWMAFSVRVVDEPTYAAWLAAQAAPAAADALEHPGAALFLANGCGACHAVRGTGADGAVGPDLTHVGGRRTIGAGALPTTAADLARWITRPAHVKPGALMPSFAALPAAEVAAIAAYLEGLR